MREFFLVATFVPLAFSALFPVINPLGSAVLFLGFVQGTDHETRKELARKIALNTVLFLVIVLLAGPQVLRFFGISLPIVQVAGGFVLATMGLSLLNKPDASSAPIENHALQSGLQAKLFYLLTFPLTVGPACVVVTLTLGAHAARASLIDTAFAHIGVIIGIVLNGIVVYISYANADRTTGRLSASMIQGILRIISFILVCIGAEIMWHGFQALAKSLR